MATAARFCTSCGTALVPGGRFCAGCGAAAAPADGIGESAGERRTVTVMFADLSAFTRLSTGRDPEETHRLLNRLFGVVDRIVVDHGGSVDKHMGDAVMAVFGAPVAHDNDPERAVRSAAALHAAVAELGSEEGLPLALHIGIGSGEVVASAVGGAGHEAYTVTGEAVNLAARLQDIAAPGETLVSDAVRRAVAGRVAVEPVGMRALRGLEAPVQVWRAGEAGAARAERTPFVGRARERRLIAALVDGCVESGRGGVVLIRGEAGIGKTRLAEEIAALAGERGLACHKALALDFGIGEGRDPIRALVRGLLGVGPEGAKRERAEKAGAALDEGVVERDRAPFLFDLLDLPPPTEDRGRFDAMDDATRQRGARETVAALVARLAARTPRLLVVEDVHWADAQALAALAEVAAAAGDAAVVLALTTRIEGDPIDQGWRAAARATPVTTVDLAPLRSEEALALATALHREQDAAVRACIERAGGNPLFLEQLIRNLNERSGEGLPASLRSLVLARMDRLPAKDKAALQAASVVGQRFELPLLRALVGDAAYRPEALVRHALVRPEGEEFLFSHALIRDGVYASLLGPAKAALHGRAARWFEGRDPTLRAQHLERAGDPGAAAAYAAAARQAAEAYRHEQALALVRRGLALAATGPDRHELRLLEGKTLHDLGRPADSLAACRGALATAADEAARGRALLGIAAAHRMTGATRDAAEALEGATAALAGAGSPLERARLHYLLGSNAFALGDAAACEASHADALAWAERAGSVEWQARALSGLGDAFYAQGRMLTALRSYDRCIALARAHGLGRVELSNRFMLGFCRYFACDFEVARAEHRATVELARAARDRNMEMIGYESLAVGGLDLVEAETILADATCGEAIAREIGARRYLSVLLGAKAWALYRLGRTAEGDAAIEESLAHCRATSERFFAPGALGILAGAARDAGIRARALAEAEALLAEGCVSHNHLWFYRLGMETALDWREWERASRYADALAAYTREEPLPWSDFWIARARALVAHGRGARDAAATAELRRLRDFAAVRGIRLALPALDAALAGR